MAYGLQTFDDKVIKEDLLDLINDVSPDTNPLSTMLGVSEAKQTVHQWAEDYISRPISNSGTVEGAAAVYSDLTTAARRTNVTQIIAQTFRVSGTERAVAAVGGDPLLYQQKKAMKQWKNKLEFALVRASLTSGASGSAQTMIGIEAAITSHYTARLSGTSLSETELNAMVLDVATDVADDQVFDMILTTLQLRQKISTFTAGSTRYVPAEDKRLTRPVAVYESDFGIHRIFGQKDVSVSAATPGPRVIGLREDKWKIAYLTGRRPKIEMLAKDGDRENGQIIGEATLEFLAERANAMRSGYAYTG